MAGPQDRTRPTEIDGGSAGQDPPYRDLWRARRTGPALRRSMAGPQDGTPPAESGDRHDYSWNNQPATRHVRGARSLVCGARYHRGVLAGIAHHGIHHRSLVSVRAQLAGGGGMARAASMAGSAAAALQGNTRKSVV